MVELNSTNEFGHCIFGCLVKGSKHKLNTFVFKIKIIQLEVFKIFSRLYDIKIVSIVRWKIYEGKIILMKISTL